MTRVGPHRRFACCALTAVSIAALASSAWAVPLTITSPNGGETFHVGQTVTITWQIDLDSVKSAVVFSFSNDGGFKRYEILSGMNLVPTNTDVYTGANGSVDWTIPDSLYSDWDPTVSTISDQCVFYVLAPYEEYEYTDLSDSVFSVTAAPPPSDPDGGRCGAGAAAALLPAIGLRVSSCLRRTKRKRS